MDSAMNEEVNYCDQCGTKTSPEAKFCSSCGSALEDQIIVDGQLIENLDKKVVKEPPTIWAPITLATIACVGALLFKANWSLENFENIEKENQNSYKNPVAIGA